MPTAVKNDATPLRPAPTEAKGTATPVAETLCTACGDTHRGRCTCASAAPTPGAQVFAFLAPLRPAGALGDRLEIQEELDGIAVSVRAFHLKQPDQVMRECAAYSARLTELCVLLHRVESLERQYTRVRTAQVERWLSELDRQFKIASRLIEVNRQDLELLK